MPDQSCHAFFAGMDCIQSVQQKGVNIVIEQLKKGGKRYVARNMNSQNNKYNSEVAILSGKALGFDVHIPILLYVTQSRHFEFEHYEFGFLFVNYHLGRYSKNAAGVFQFETVHQSEKPSFLHFGTNNMYTCFNLTKQCETTEWYAIYTTRNELKPDGKTVFAFGQHYKRKVESHFHVGVENNWIEEILKKGVNFIGSDLVYVEMCKRACAVCEQIANKPSLFVSHVKAHSTEDNINTLLPISFACKGKKCAHATKTTNGMRNHYKKCTYFNNLDSIAKELAFRSLAEFDLPIPASQITQMPVIVYFT